MTAPTKNYTSIADSLIDQDSPLTTTLMTYIRDNIVHLEEWLGGSFTAAIDHDHDGSNSASVAGASGGKYIIVDHYIGTGAIGTHTAMRNKPDVMFFSKVDVTGTVPCLKHVGDDTTEASPLSTGGKTTPGLTDITYGGCHQTAAGSFNTVSVKFAQLLLKAYTGLIAYGTYTGTGSSQNVSVGFQPEMVAVWRATNASASAPVYRFDSHSSTDSQTMGSGMSTTSITAIISTGFTVLSSTQANTSAVDYAYLALKSGSVSGEKIKYKTWSGNSSSGRQLTGVGFAPQAAWILRTDTSSNLIWVTQDMMPSQVILNDGTLTGSLVLEFLEDGIEVGSAAAINATGGTYAAIFFQGGRL